MTLNWQSLISRTRTPFAVLMVCALAVLLTAPVFDSTATGAANPAPIAAGDDWELEFTPGPLRIYLDAKDGEAYWYFTYTVANRTTRDRMWAPRMELFTDDGKIMSSGRDVPTRVKLDIKKFLGDPLLEDQNRIIGELLVGRENARNGLAVWPAKNLDTTEITLFVGGLSSDFEMVKNPKTKKDVRLQKTLRREYMVPGNPLQRGSDPLILIPRKNRRGPGCSTEFPKGGCWIFR